MTIKTYKSPRCAIATDYGARIPVGGTIDLSTLQPTSDGSYQIPAGLGWQRGVVKNGKEMLQPAKTLTNATAVVVGDLTIKVADGFACVAAPGDGYQTVEDYAAIAVSGTFDGTETITVTLDGDAYVIEVSDISSFTLADVAQHIAQSLDSLLTVDAMAEGESAHLFADPTTGYSLTVAVAGGTGAATASAANLGQFLLGTVEAVNVSDGSIALAPSGAAGDFPTGTHFSTIPSQQRQILGFTPTDFDPETNRANIGLWASGTYSKGDLPFPRTYVKAFPELKLA